MDIILVNRFYAPDISATSQLVTDLAEHLSAQGHKVSVLCSRQYYDRPDDLLPRREIIKGVTVKRLWTTTFGRGNIMGRAMDFLSFYIAFTFTALRLFSRKNLVICCTDPPLVSIPCAMACRLKGARMINWLQDLYPEVAVSLGVIAETSVLTTLLKKLRNWSLRVADANVALGDVMATRVSALAPLTTLCVIHNWSDIDPGTTRHSTSNNSHPLRRDWGLENVFIAGYSGNLGKAHEIATLIAAAELLRGNENVRFLIIGGGYYYQHLMTEATQRQLANIVFKPYQPRDCLELSLTLPDVHLVILNPEMEGCIVPSKYYGAAAAAKPVIFIGAETGEIAQIVNASQSGMVVPPGNGTELARILLELSNDPDRVESLGRNSLEGFQQRFASRHALQAWQQLIESFNQG